MKNLRAHFRAAVRIVMDTNTLLDVDHMRGNDLTNFEKQLFSTIWLVSTMEASNNVPHFEFFTILTLKSFNSLEKKAEEKAKYAWLIRTLNTMDKWLVIKYKTGLVNVTGLSKSLFKFWHQLGH
jgi:hypothetical protein